MEHKISIIVPVYNTAKFLDKCFESIINQTYENLEIIVVNDGSTDNSLEICRKYASKDPRFVLLNQENGGLSVARNNALKCATGKYIGFVDSDDFIQLDMYEKLLNLIDKYKLDAVLCNIDDNTNNNEIKINLDTMQIYDSILQDKIGCQLWRILFTKDLWDGITSPPRRYYEDMFILPKVLLRAKKIGSTNEKLYNYYSERSDNISNSPNNYIKGGIDRSTAFFERFDFMIQNGYDYISEIVLNKAVLAAKGCLYFVLINKDLKTNNDVIYLKKLLNDHYSLAMNSKVINLKTKFKLFLMVKLPFLFKILYKLSLFVKRRSTRGF